MPPIPKARRRHLPSGQVGGVVQPLSTADTGQGLVARGLGQAGQGLGRLGMVMGELGLRQKRADDDLATTNASAARQFASDSLAKKMADDPNPANWEGYTKEAWESANAAYNQQTWNDDVTAEKQRVLHEVYESDFFTRASVATTTKTVDNAEISTEAAFIDSFAQGALDVEDKQETYMGALLNKYSPEVAEVMMAETVAKATKAREVVASNFVYAEIEAASNPVSGGNFEMAKNAAKNPNIDEKSQATLRTAIKTAERAWNTKRKDAQAALKAETTSTTIREHFQGKMSIPELTRRHEAGLLTDSVFERISANLAETIPKTSDPVAAGKIRRANNDLALGAITRAEADDIVLFNYVKLDGPDREGVIADLEDIEAKIIASAKSNAFSEGKGLMSVEFIGLQDQGALVALLNKSKKTPAQKKEINNRYVAELDNRDLYERAINDRFVEMRKDGVSKVNDYTAESLAILLQYRKRKNLGLAELQRAVAAEQQAIIARPATDKLTELEQIRARKRALGGTNQ